MRMRPYPLALLVLALLIACGEVSTPGTPLELRATGFETAFLGEPYSVTIQVAGGLSPYRYALKDGELPPGLSLQGGTVRGVPTQVGRYTFTIEIFDANLSRTFREFTIQVTEPPPAALVLNVPLTELRQPFTLRVRVAQARQLQALRTLLSFDPTRFRLIPDSIRPIRNDLALFWHHQGGTINIDVAVLGGSLNGEHGVFELSFEPLAPSTMELIARTEFLSQGGRHAFSQLREGVPAGRLVDELTEPEEERRQP